MKVSRWIPGLLAVFAAGAGVFFWPALSWRAPQIETTPVSVRASTPGADGAVVRGAGWPSFGGAAGGGQYSPAAQITAQNVGRLQVAWVHRSGDYRHADPDRKVRGTSLEVTPILANDTLFYCTPLNRVFALDPATGRERWVIDLDAAAGGEARATGTCRGVAYWEGAPSESAVASADAAAATCARRIFKGDVRSRLFAIDADTGELCRDFGGRGWVELNALDEGRQAPIAMTSPPVVWRDLVMTGSSVLDNFDTDVADGIVRAFDARTGELRWSFNPIPPEMSARTGGANVWTIFSVDEANGLVFLPTTSPSNDAWGATRLDPIPLANSLVALDAATGEVRWSYQIVRHDIFDYDLPAQPILFELERDGRRIPAVAQTTKMGFTYVFDRLTGEPLFPIEERPVPASDVEGERASPTQPVPTLPEPFARQELSRRAMFGITLAERAACRREFDRRRYDGMYTPISLRGSILFPSALGGGNWGGAALDPVNQLLVVKAQNIASWSQLVPTDEADRKANPPLDFLNQPLRGTPYRLQGGFMLSPWGVPCVAPPWGELTALDLRTGRTAWRIPLGTVPVGPFRTPAAWGSPNVGGPLILGSGVVIVAATMDSRIRAFDLADGRELWSSRLPAPGMAVPMTYETGEGAARRQFVVIAAGGNAIAKTRVLGDAIVAYALP